MSVTVVGTSNVPTRSWPVGGARTTSPWGTADAPDDPARAPAAVTTPTGPGPAVAGPAEAGQTGTGQTVAGQTGAGQTVAGQAAGTAPAGSAAQAGGAPGATARRVGDVHEQAREAVGAEQRLDAAREAADGAYEKAKRAADEARANAPSVKLLTADEIRAMLGIPPYQALLENSERAAARHAEARAAEDLAALDRRAGAAEVDAHEKTRLASLADTDPTGDPAGDPERPGARDAPDPVDLYA